MAKPLVSDELWTAIETLLPPALGKKFGGRPHVPDRAALTGILFVLKIGIPWNMLTPKMNCSSGSTCWRRLRDWQEAGVCWPYTICCWHGCNWPSALIRSNAPLGILEPRRRGHVECACAKGGTECGPNPTDRGKYKTLKQGMKHHLMVDCNGLPLVSMITGANATDCNFLLPLVDALPPLCVRQGKRHRPYKLHADKAYDSAALRQGLKERFIIARIARRGMESSERLGCYR